MIDRFLTYMHRELNRSENTVAAYERDLRQFATWITADASDRHFDPASVTTSDIRAWLAIIAGTDSPVTIRRKTSALRAFFRWMARNGLIDANPASDIVLAKRRRDLPEIVVEKEMDSILASAGKAGTDRAKGKGNDSADDREKEEYLRERRDIILGILYDTGLRESELLGITDRDIDLSAREMKVTGKRNKQRVIPLPKSLAGQIARWQRIRDARNPVLPSPAPLIPGRNGPMSRMQLYRIVNSALESTSATRKSPHTLRHSFATAMLNGGANLDVVKEMLGHASLSTTQIYTHLSFDELLRSYRDSHPRSRK